MKKILHIASILTALTLPSLAFAATASTIQDVLRNVGNIIKVATPIVISLALLGFFWGIALYVFQSGEPEKRKKGLSLMIWGVVALFVMLSVFGIINALQLTLGVGHGTIQVPTISR